MKRYEMYLMISIVLAILTITGCRDRSYQQSTALNENQGPTKISFFQDITEIPFPTCAPDEEPASFALSESLPLPTWQDLKFTEEVALNSPGSLFEKYLVQLYLCTDLGGSPRLAGLVLVKIYLGTSEYYLVIPGSGASIKGLTEMVFGGDIEAFEVETPFFEQFLRIQGKLIGQRSLGYVGVGEKVEEQFKPMGWATVGKFELKDIFRDEDACALGAHKREKILPFVSRGVTIEVEYCELPGTRSNDIEITQVKISDPELGSTPVTLKKRDPDFADKVKYVLTQHNLRDTFTISHQQAVYHFAQYKMTASYEGKSKWSESLDCLNGIVTCRTP